MIGVLLALSLFSASEARGADLAVIQDLIDATPGGEVLRLPPGHYHGHWIISRSITLRADRDVILDGDDSGSVLRVQAADVRIEGVELRGTGTVLGNGDSAIYAENSPRFVLRNSVIKNALFGAQILGSPDSLLEGNEIEGDFKLDVGRRGDAVKIWYSPGTRVVGNHITNSRDVLIWYSDGSIAQGNTIEKMRYGLHYMYSHKSVAEENVIQNNSVGIYEMYSNDLRILRNHLIDNRGPSGYGFAAKESDRATIVGNRIIRNRVGLYVDNSPLSPPRAANENTLFQDNLVARNDIGVNFIGSCVGSLFLKNDFVDNWQQVSTQGLSKNEQRVWENNYWSDYRGVDPAGTGIGRTPHVADSLVDSITDRVDGFKIFNFGPALLALEFAERIVPWLRPEPKIVDHSPSMQWHVEADRAVNSFGQRAGLLGFAMILFGLVVGLRRGFIL